MPKSSALTETIAGTATLRLAQLPESEFFCTPIEDRFECLTRLARLALKVPVAAITFLNHNRQWFKSVSGWAVTELPHNQSFCPITLAAGDLTVFEDTHQIPAFSKHSLVTKGPKFRFYAGMPIRDEHGNLCGTFCIFDQKPRQLSHEEKEALSDLASMTEREIFGDRMRSAQAQLATKLSIARRESMMDPLTRLWNRRGASVVIKSALDAARQHGSLIGIAILDLDNFKRINDTYGHQVGDEVLRKTALRLIHNIRTNDNVCRIGGDEFILLMKDIDSASAHHTTERLRRCIVDNPIPTRLGQIRMSISVGFTLRPIDADTTVSDLINLADQALLQSKAKGRDKVVEVA